MTARQDDKRREGVFPNLGEAAMTQTPGAAPRTLAEIAAQQRADAENPEAAKERKGLSPETIEGLRAVKAEQERAEAEARAREPVAAQGAGDVTDRDIDEAFVNDPELRRALREAREEDRRNARERAAIAERCAPIDLSSGLVDGDFSQLVPIVPGQLEVKFKCLTTGDFEALRLFLLDRVDKEPRLQDVMPSTLSFYQTVASVQKLNKTTFPSIYGADGSFSAEAFGRKLKIFEALPAPLIATLNRHGVWFERRVQDLFATPEALKNG